MIFDKKTAMKKGQTETMAFTHKVLNSKEKIKVNVHVWNQFLDAKGVFKKHFSKKEVIYNVK